MSDDYYNDSDIGYGHSDDEDHYNDYDEHDEDDERYTDEDAENSNDSQTNTTENPEDNVQKDNKWLVQRKVINETMIREAVREELFLDYDKMYVPEAHEINLRDVTTLVLSFRSIDSINNLHGFVKLKKLQLDNNLIEKISNLDHLVNLEWLDLSFNFIREITGLEKLTKLRDLSLFNNRLTNLSGLDNLKELTILSIGNNNIKDLEQIRHIRVLKKLRALNARGNPIYKEDDYTHTILAYLPDLKYLDYQLVSTKQVKDAYDKKMEIVLDLVQQEQALIETEKLEKAEMEHQERLKGVGLYVLHGLFDNLLAKDKELHRLQILPGYMEILEQYRTKFDEIVEKLTQDCLAQVEIKKRETEIFTESIEKVICNTEQQLLDMKYVFEQKVKAAIDSGNGELLMQCKKQAIRLCDDMMEVETEVVRKVSMLIEIYTEQYMKLSKSAENIITNGFALLGECTKSYEHSLLDHVHALLERLNRDSDISTTNTGSSGGSATGTANTTTSTTEGTLSSLNATGVLAQQIQQQPQILGLPPNMAHPSTWSPELLSILNDKDQLTNAVVSSYDHHYALVLKSEEEARSFEESHTETHLRNIQSAECKRYTTRTNDIYTICEEFIKKLNEQGRLLFGGSAGGNSSGTSSSTGVTTANTNNTSFIK